MFYVFLHSTTIHNRTSNSITIHSLYWSNISTNISTILVQSLEQANYSNIMTSQNGRSGHGSSDHVTTTTSTGMNQKAIVYMILLAIQFGIQPIITRRYTLSTINKSTVLLVQEIIKFIMAYSMLLISGDISHAIQGKLITPNTGFFIQDASLILWLFYLFFVVCVVYQ